MGFIILCVLPLCAVLCGAVWLRSDAHKLWHERSLSQRLALEVTLDRVVLTAPEGVRYEGLTVADPETGALLAEVDALSILRRDQNWHVTAVAPELHLARLDGLQELISRQLRLGKPGERIQVTTDSVVLHSPGKQPLTLEVVRGQFNFTKPAAEAAIEFRPVDKANSSGRPIAVRVVRNRQTTPPSMGFEINASESALPCALLAPFFPVVNQFGPDCKFRGIAWANATEQGWNGKLLESKLTDVDLATVVAEQFPRQLSGMATIAIGGADISGGRIEQLHGELVCHGGTIHRELATLLTHELMLSGNQIGQTFGASHPLIELAFAFALDSKGLLLTGRCDSAAPGAVLVDHVGKSIGEPRPAARLPLSVLEAVFSHSRATLIGVLPKSDDGRQRR